MTPAEEVRTGIDADATANGKPEQVPARRDGIGGVDEPNARLVQLAHVSRSDPILDPHAHVTNTRAK